MSAASRVDRKVDVTETQTAAWMALIAAATRVGSMVDEMDEYSDVAWAAMMADATERSRAVVLAVVLDRQMVGPMVATMDYSKVESRDAVGAAD
jgi:hypothetical protein